MAPNWRPLQDIENRTIYQCQDMVDAEIVDKAIDISVALDTDYDALSTWQIIGIVFICLFTVSVVVIISLSSMLCTSEYEQPPSASPEPYSDARKRSINSAQTPLKQ
eukprot:TRINITY_DN7953_c0_g1_i1.p1 TRINITY_DN7953_c0_g1~~TRINITY_DN7953_c0_g1_i1.p1  ORF type:complete len:116 (-),score=27.59 TRINITY_DN7953_c0_g1_i1:302-622(-)